MLKYILCVAAILLCLADIYIFVDLKKYIKIHENELVEKHRKGLLTRVIAMLVMHVFIAIIGLLCKLVL